jgi:hypothetical protein
MGAVSFTFHGGGRAKVKIRRDLTEVRASEPWMARLVNASATAFRTVFPDLYGSLGVSGVLLTLFQELG